MIAANNRGKQTPVIFLAFANDRVNHTRYLRNLPMEHRGIRNVLDKAKKLGLCEIVERTNVAIEDILDVFQDETYKDRIAIFHYAGHAKSYQLLLESFNRVRTLTYKQGLVSFFSRQKGLKLIFLNGCSSEQHALELELAGIEAVIATSQDIDDKLATQLAIRFYHGIINGLALKRAWLDAEDYIKIQRGSSNFDSMYWFGKKRPTHCFPWNVYFSEGAEKVKGWNLSDTLNAPLFGYGLEDKQKMPQKPIIFTTFANDRLNHTRYLRNLQQEQRWIRKVLDNAKKAGLCEVVERTNATIEDILDVFQDETYKDRIAIFHYGDHADSYKLLLETAAGARSFAHNEGLVSFFARQKSLRLIFLNACSTHQYALELIQAGIPAVILSSQLINDEVAAKLAIRFYHGIANGFTLERAWREAEDEIKIRIGSSNFNAMYHYSQQEKHHDRFPWDIYFKEGAEKIKIWNLPDAANDPLFGLPPLPRTEELPEKPFLFLNRYERKHAELFFGRSYYIRGLYGRLIDKKLSPIILLYGQSGVGKSSLLEAGLLPRLEESHIVIYIRRILEKGLLGTLEGYLEKHFSLLTKSINNDHLPLGEIWKFIESKTGMPLVIILDQVEEVYTHINKNLPHELENFMMALKTVFEDTALYPKGKLILSYRKEYHPEIDEQFKHNELDRSGLFLQPLNQQDIIEVVTGLTSTQRLQEIYNLKIEDQLPFIIANDLLEDENSPLTPTLQIVLTKMWDNSKVDFSPIREFTINRYRTLLKSGLLMTDFFNLQMEQLQNWEKEVVDSGLALGLLKYHTTELGSACSRNIENIRQTFSHRLDMIDDLLIQLKNLYLLTDTQRNKNETSLGHDILAPIVIKEYNDFYKSEQSRLGNKKEIPLSESQRESKDTLMKIFISYSHKDKKFVNRLCSDLEKAGTSVWLDEKEIKVGDSISKKIEDGISKCDFFCLVISRHSVNSKWVEREYRTALNMQLSPGTTPKILPLLIEEVELPLLLREIKYADFSTGYKSGFTNLLNAIKKQQ